MADGPGRSLADGPPLLQIRDLAVKFDGPDGGVEALRGINLEVRHGEVLGLIGESGSGKTVTALAVLGLLPAASGRVVRGQATWLGRNLLGLPERALRPIRGGEIGVIFQDPLTSLHPSYRVADQIAEAIRAHATDVSRAGAATRATELLDRVGVPAGHAHRAPYPHQWSGGMRQRAMIAMALANGPRLLIADEPTTALDVTIQAQILDLLRHALRETGASALLITHDLSVVAELADRVAVMHAGRIVETRSSRDLFATPRHPRTRELLAEHARLVGRTGWASAAPADRATFSSGSTTQKRDESALRVTDLVVEYSLERWGRRAATLRAVDGVTFELRREETLALVGESGCGKSTLARTLLRLQEPSAGRVFVGDRQVTQADGRRLRSLRREIQIVFQDPYASLNPRRTVGEALAAPLRAHGLFAARGGWEWVHELLAMVELDAALVDRFPYQLSGGQRQRVGIARALALQPRVLILDEPVSSLDASIRGRILALLAALQRRLGLSYLLIAHDLSLVRAVAHRVAVMYLGRLVEIGWTPEVFERPAHPYTKALLSAIPVPDPGRRRRSPRIVLEGEVPDPADPPNGCRFHTRCWKVRGECREAQPTLQVHTGPGHACACFYPEGS